MFSQPPTLSPLFPHSPSLQGCGLSRRCAPRNDKGGGPCTRRHASVFCMSLRTSAHTGVAIRSPRRETWQAGNTLGEFVTHCEFALNSALFTPYRRSYGLPRRCAPRNDKGGEALAPADTCPSSACHCEPVRTLAWQSASPQGKLTSWQYFGRIRTHLRIRPKFCSFYALPQGMRIATSLRSSQ